MRIDDHDLRARTERNLDYFGNPAGRSARYGLPPLPIGRGLNVAKLLRPVRQLDQSSTKGGRVAGPAEDLLHTQGLTVDRQRPVVIWFFSTRIDSNSSVMRARLRRAPKMSGSTSIARTDARAETRGSACMVMLL